MTPASKCRTCRHSIVWVGLGIHACIWQPPKPWPYWRVAGGAKFVDPNAKDCQAWEAKEVTK